MSDDKSIITFTLMLFSSYENIGACQRALGFVSFHLTNSKISRAIRTAWNCVVLIKGYEISIYTYESVSAIGTLALRGQNRLQGIKFESFMHASCSCTLSCIYIYVYTIVNSFNKMDFFFFGFLIWNKILKY